MACRIRMVFPDWFLNELADEQEKKDLLAGKIKGSEHVHFKCSFCGLVYTQRICNHISSDDKPKQGCPKCAKQKRADAHKLTSSKKRIVYPQWFIDELYNEEDKEKAKAGILSTHTKVKFKCSCGEVYEQQITNHIKLSTGERKYGNCPECSKMAIGESYRKSIGTLKPYPQWFIDELYLDEDKEKAKIGSLSSGKSVLFWCPVCGNVYKQRVASHIKLSTGEKKKGCPKCGIDKQIESSRKTKGFINPYPEWFIDELYLEEDKEKAKITNFYGDEEKQFYCKEHDVIYTQKVKYHIDLKTHEKLASGCSECSKNKLYKTLSSKRVYPDWFIDDLVNEEDKEKAKSGVLKSTDIVEFKCSNSHIYKQVVRSHICLDTQEKLSGCPICARQRSKTELELEDFIHSLGYDTTHTRFFINNKSIEIDIYIPDKNIGIEYHGSFWHKTLPDDGFVKPRLFHQKKYTLCSQIGIHLISIFDIDWLYNSNKIKEYLIDLLKNKEIIYARKCTIKKITKTESNDFYSKYHLLGTTVVQDVSYGLFYNDELVSCMSFQLGRYKEENKPVWCLSRFVTKSGVTIIGGASKLLKYFEREYEPSILVSFSDNDYFNGGVYDKLGFECKGCTSYPRYFWYLEDQEIKREQCQLKKLSKKYPDLYKESLNISGNKEDYIMLKLGAFKVYRSGHTKWVKKYN